jgi:hypothetical protein
MLPPLVVYDDCALEVGVCENFYILSTAFIGNLLYAIFVLSMVVKYERAKN